MIRTSVEIAQLWVPESLTAADAADFLAAAEVARQVRVQTWGNDDLAYTPAEFLQAFNDPYERLTVLVARVDSTIVGRVGISMPLADNTDLAIVSLEILPHYQGTGVGRALLQAAEQYARGEMRRLILVETHHPATSLAAAGSETLPALNGGGALPLVSREVVFAQMTGYELQRVQPFSACRLPVDSNLLERSRREALEVSGPDYSVHSWTNTCPAEWVADMAVLEELMCADAPFAGIAADDAEYPPWDEARVREAEVLTSASGRRTLVCAVEHRPTGRLVGFTAISMLGHREDIVFQDETVVVQEHRGRKLGMLIKVENLQRLVAEQTEARKIYAWNAAEKDYMMVVNDALGFAVAGYTGEWTKQLER